MITRPNHKETVRVTTVSQKTQNNSLCNGGWCYLFQVFHAPLLQELQDGGRLGPHRDVGHQGKVLHQAHSSSLLGWKQASVIHYTLKASNGYDRTNTQGCELALQRCHNKTTKTGVAYLVGALNSVTWSHSNSDSAHE